MWPFSKGNESRQPQTYRPLEFTGASTGIDKFMTLALASGLVHFSQLRDACADFDTNRTDDKTVDELCNLLVNLGLITRWQCDKLRQGKFKGFFLDGYLLLRQLGKSETISIYLCREVATDKLHVMDVVPAPIDPIKDGKIYYTVREYVEAMWFESDKQSCESDGYTTNNS